MKSPGDDFFTVYRANTRCPSTQVSATRNIGNIFGRDLHDVLVQNDKISPLTRFQRTGQLLHEPGVRGIERKCPDCFFTAYAFFG